MSIQEVTTIKKTFNPYLAFGYFAGWGVLHYLHPSIWDPWTIFLPAWFSSRYASEVVETKTITKYERPPERVAEITSFDVHREEDWNAVDSPGKGADSNTQGQKTPDHP